GRGASNRSARRTVTRSPRSRRPSTRASAPSTRSWRRKKSATAASRRSSTANRVSACSARRLARPTPPPERRSRGSACRRGETALANIMAFDPAALLGALDAPQLEALIDTMVLAAAADGQISDEEQTVLAARMSTFAAGTPHAETLAAGALSGRIAATYSRILGDDQDRVVAAIKTKLPSLDQRK